MLMEPNLASAGLRAMARAATLSLLLVIPGSTASTIMSACVDRHDLRTPIPAPLDDRPRGMGLVGGTDTCPVRYGLVGTDTLLLELCDGAGRRILTLQRMRRDSAVATAQTFNRRGDPIRRQCMVGTSLPELLGGEGTIVWTEALIYWYVQDGNWTKRTRTTSAPGGGSAPDGATELTTREPQYRREPSAPR